MNEKEKYSSLIGEKVYRQGVVSVEKSYFEDEKEYFPFVLSTTALDSDNEVVDITSAKLERFMANPVGFFQHESYRLPILTWHNIRMEGAKLVADAHFHELPNEEGLNLSKTIKDYVKAGVLKAVSIGFRYMSMPEQMNVDGKTIWVIKEPELFEASIVTIPANPEALIVGDKVKAYKEKIGATLNKTNRQRIQSIKDLAEEVLADAEPEESKSVTFEELSDSVKTIKDSLDELRSMLKNMIEAKQLESNDGIEQSQTAEEVYGDTVTLTLEDYLKLWKKK